jgi:hypothetical protein
VDGGRVRDGAQVLPGIDHLKAGHEDQGSMI